MYGVEDLSLVAFVAFVAGMGAVWYAGRLAVVLERRRISRVVRGMRDDQEFLRRMHQRVTPRPRRADIAVEYDQYLRDTLDPRD